MKIKENYNHTIYACYFGYITQAVVNNFAPLLFLTFQREYGISLDKIAFLVTLNFGVQLVVDFLSAKFVDRVGYRICVVTAHLLAAIGILGLAVLPGLMNNPYYGLMISIVCYAIGGGLIEVLISPIVEACPTKKKEAAMSLLHSFYCWGHMAVVIGSTLFFSLAGIENWKILACIWAVLPLFTAFYFCKVPIYTIVAQHEGMGIRALIKNKAFWLLFVLMVCAGASEQGMSQWASAFAESGLKVSKTVGDLAGPCMFALFMGIARAAYAKYSEKIKLTKFMALCTVLCIAAYLIAAFAKLPLLGLVGCGLCGFSVGIMWPGTFSIAAQKLPKGGTALYALLALSGDLGCSAGPAFVGVVSEKLGGNLQKGLLAAVVFPAMLGLCLFLSRASHNRKGKA